MKMLSVFFTRRELIYALLKRDLTSRYKGSVLGFSWFFIMPILMLAVYTFFFGVVFKSRWDAVDSTAGFSLVLFSGLIVFNFFSETVNRSVGLIVTNPSYVKKIVFPVELLAWVNVLSGVIVLFITLLVWLVFYIAFIGVPPLTFFLFPVVLLPLVFLCLGLSWFISSMAVYFRDTGQFISVITTALMFMSPVFFPIKALPVAYQYYAKLNPLTVVIEQFRGVVFFGVLPSFQDWIMGFCISLLIMYAGFYWFMITRRGFADVI